MGIAQETTEWSWKYILFSQENVYSHIEKGQARNKPQFISQSVNINIITINKPCPLVIALFFCDKIP